MEVLADDIRGLRPALRGWKRFQLSASNLPFRMSPTRLEGMETPKAAHRAATLSSSPTRLEGMETFVADRLTAKQVRSPTRLEGMETKFAMLRVTIGWNGLRPALRGWKQHQAKQHSNGRKRSPTRLEGMETSLAAILSGSKIGSPTRLEGMETTGKSQRWRG